MKTIVTFSSFWVRTVLTLLLTLFVSASAWAHYVIVFVNPEDAGTVYSGKSPDLLTEGFIDDAQAGDFIFFKVIPNQGYHIDYFDYDGNLTADDVTESDGIYSFVMPDLGEGLAIVQIQIFFERDPVVAEGVEINEDNFPDGNFRDWLLAQPYGDDAVITDEEMAGITRITARGLGIQNLKGIEYFTQLTDLDISNNPETMPEGDWNRIAELDLASNTNLRTLWCDYNQLHFLNLNENTELRELSCSNNQLDELVLGFSENLQKLTCSNNQLPYLNVLGFPNLAGLWCDGNQLHEINVSGNQILELFQCENNQLTSIEGLQGHSVLRLLNCNDNQLHDLNVNGCSELYQLYCWNNQIQGEDMKHLMESLPERNGYCVVLDLRDGAPEQNVITNEQIAIGKVKGWSVEGKTGDAENDVVPLGSEGPESVDLGLPSGTLWATCNVGASSPQDIGLYFAWGETEGHGNDLSDGYLFDWNNYKWAEVLDEESYFTKYCVDGSRGLDGFSDNKYFLDPEDDAATVLWGDQWRTPSSSQFKELRENCNWEQEEVHGVPGYRVTGPNGNSIFLPVTGWRIDDRLNEGGSYWARNAKADGDGGACQLAWDDWGWYEYGGRCNGQCVRPVVNVEPEVPVYYLIGEFCGWDENNMLPFTDNEGTSLTTTFSGPFKIKDKDGNWLSGDGSHNTLTRDEPSVALQPEGQDLRLEIPAEYLLVIENNELTVYDFLTGYFIAGDFNGWQPEPLTDNGNGTYTIQMNISENQEFKFLDADGRWYGGDTHNQGDKYGVNSGWCTDIPLTEGDAGSNFIINAGGFFTIVLTDDNGSLKFDVYGFDGLIALTDNADNTEAIESGMNAPHDVKLLGRTLYRDGYWNTLCMPFDVDNIMDSPLAGAEIRTLDGAILEDGTLTLNFGAPLPMIMHGVPYIIRWTDYDGDDLDEPIFHNVQIMPDLHPWEFEGTVTFMGTYSPVSISSAGDNTKLYLGEGDQLFYPQSAMTIGCQRAYFQLAEGITAGEADEQSMPIKAFVLNFGEENGISVVNANSPEGAGWYDLRGNRHEAMPTAPGIYIHNGRKFVVK